jgi:DNA helicase-2/ATP-dependent DNA helicase PcrA
LQLGRTELRDVAAEIEWAKVTQVRPADYPAAAAKSGRTPPAGIDELARLFAAYEEMRRDRHLIDFESVLELTAAILADHRQAAEQVRDQYRYFVVDEYQDVNPLQKLLLDAWLGDRDDLCVVGDPHQTIYSFTGATPGYLTGFATEFADATVIRLVRDYRSTPQVVVLANRLLKAGGNRVAGTLVGQRPSGPEPVFTEYGDEQEEAAGVAEQVRILAGGGMAAREVAVLVRANAQTEGFERAFAEAGVPYQVRGAERFFDRREVRQAVALLRTAARQEWPDPAEAAARALTQEVRDVLSGLGLTGQPPVGGGAARERWESLAAIAQLADDLAGAVPGATLADFAAELTGRAAAEHAPVLEGVTLASLHAAKGLEWDAVFLPGLVDGMVPITYAQTPEEIEEERRLLYVGVTRARERVHLSWSLARSAGGRRSRRSSRFLDGIRPVPAPQGQAPARRGAREEGMRYEQGAR